MLERARGNKPIDGVAVVEFQDKEAEADAPPPEVS